MIRRAGGAWIDDDPRMTTRRPWARWAVMVVVAGCDPELGARTEEISGGVDDAIDVAVVGIVDDATSATCTGTLVAPGLVLTAQHCVAQPIEVGACDRGSFGPPAPAARFHVTTRPAFTPAPADYHGVVEIRIPPGSGFCDRDVALLRLSAPIGAAEARPIAPRLDPPPAAAERYAAIGYGATDDLGTGAGTRRRRDGLAAACVGTACASTFLGAAEWRGEAGVCMGDSGGPALDEAGRVIGVASRGAVGCVAPTYVTVAAHADWLVDEAVRAAGLGGYPPPPWTGAMPPLDAGLDGPIDDAGDAGCGCNTSAPSPSFLLPLALLLYLRRRRGATTTARASSGSESPPRWSPRSGCPRASTASARPRSGYRRAARRAPAHLR